MSYNSIWNLERIVEPNSRFVYVRMLIFQNISVDEGRIGVQFMLEQPLTEEGVTAGN